MQRPRQPGNLSHLQRWLTEWAEVEGTTTGRLNRRVAVLVVAAMLDGLRDDDGRHRFIAKGGAALEMRFGSRARTSKDFDAIYRGNLAVAKDSVAAVASMGWNGFVGRVVGGSEIEVPGLTTRPIRFQVKLSYKGRPFATVPMEVAAPEGDALSGVDTVAVSLAPVGLSAPEAVPCLSVPYQIAQKLHACTDPLDGDRPNDRAHDLADLILLEELVDAGDLSEVRDACLEIFALRGRQPWPPLIVPPQHWRSLWAGIVEHDDFPVVDLSDAVARVQTFIDRIASSE